MNSFSAKSVSNIFLLKKLWNQLNKKRKIQICFIIFLIFINGLAEFISFASVIPFLRIITDSNYIINNNFLKKLFNFFGIYSFNQIAIVISSIFVLTIFISAFIRIINIWFMTKISAEIGTDLSVSIYNKVLHQPYIFHLNTNSNELSTAVTYEVDRTTQCILLFLQFIAGIIMMSCLVFGFISFNWYIGTPTVVTYALLYLSFMVAFKYRLSRNSRRIVSFTENQLKSVNNGLGAIRDILLDNNQEEYVNNFKSSDYPLRKLTAEKYFLGVMPRFILEALGIILIVFLSIYLVLKGYQNSFIITLLGGVALISQKLLPSMQLCYNSWSILTNTKSSVLKVLRNLELSIDDSYSRKIKQLIFFKEIKIKSLNFKFNNDVEKFVLKDINLTIKKGERIGILGKTGSGKTTLINIIMGLIEPTSGQLLVDDSSIYSKIDKYRQISWQKSIAHVPQNIYLSDQSFAENIAFGISKNKIDMSKVRRVAEMAEISTFITSHRNGYETYVGERGIRLSGGQRQRIALARALYKNTKVLILDEATSALDNKTEKSIMKSINNLNKDITIIMVAHRTSTLSECDQIIELNLGSIKNKY